MKLTLFFIFLVCTNIVHAQQCISGRAGSNALLNQLHNQVTRRPGQPETVASIIYKQYQLAPSTEGSFCHRCQESSRQPVNGLNYLPFNGHEIPNAPKLLYKLDCVHAAMKVAQIARSTPEVDCPSGQARPNAQMCMTEDFLKYQNAAISSMMKCVKSLEFKGVNTSAFFTMLTLETGFRPQYSWRGGTGLTQMTSVFTQDVHKEHRGLPLLKKLRSANSEVCRPAQMIADKDLKSPDTYKHPSRNKCAFTSIGDGMERSILYTLIGMEVNWQRSLSRRLTPYLNKWAGSNDAKRIDALEDIKQAIILNSFGSGGMKNTLSLISRTIQSYPNHTPEQMLALLRRDTFPVQSGEKLNRYIMYGQRKQNELIHQIKDNPIVTSNYLTDGTKACINTNTE